MLNTVLQRLVDERGHIHEAIDQVLASASDEDRDPSEAETELLKRHRGRLEELEPQIEELLRTEETRQAAADARQFLTRASGARPEAEAEAPADGQPVYRNFGEFARDEIIRRFPIIAARAGAGAVEAAEARLERAVAHTLTADIPGLLPTQHLAQITDVINKARPVVSAMRQVALNSGQVTYPKITQRPIVGPQTAEKTELPSQKMTVGMNTEGATVYGGAGNLSWQDIAWSNPDALALWFDLAAEAYARQTEAAACAELMSDADAAVPVATDDLAGWMDALSSAAGQIYKESGRRPDTLALDITSGYHLLGLVGVEAPIFVAAGSGNLNAGTGTVAGLKLVITDGLADDSGVVFDSSAVIAAETPGAPVELRAVEPSIAGFEVGVIGAFLAATIEPLAVLKINPPGGAAARRGPGRPRKDEA